MSIDQNVYNLIAETARRYRVDPAAALSVAQGEGGIRYGAVGDQGTSFGPFQLHVGGALPRGQGPEFANSPAGIEYAIRKMAEAGAAGLTGPAAVDAIVRKFERPAAPDVSIRNAVERLRSHGGVGGIAPSFPNVGVTGSSIGAFNSGSSGSFSPVQLALLQSLLAPTRIRTFQELMNE